jgi:hypothetical protein
MWGDKITPREKLICNPTERSTTLAVVHVSISDTLMVL